MNAHQCIRCGDWWASQTGAAPFRWITRYCPICLVLISTKLEDPEWGPSWHGRTGAELEAEGRGISLGG